MSDTERSKVDAICRVAGVKEIDDLSDGFHTFRQLYYQRMMLFATIIKQNRDRAWKSLRHEDGELCFGGGWFIVGIDTPEGSYTYHYENKYFDLFDCEILDYSKHWDGHTEKDITRLLSLPSAQPETLQNLTKPNNELKGWIPCSGTEDIPDHEVLCCDRYGNEMKDLSEAIRHAEEVAEKYECNSRKFVCCDNVYYFQQCAEEYRQLAEWLKELKSRREVMQKLKDEIATFKKPMAEKYEKLEGNKNYLTGYLSALSVVEGMIAEVNMDNDNISD